MDYRMRLCESIEQIQKEHWNSLLAASSTPDLHPAMRHEYLSALERSGSATAETGWGGLHLAMENEQGMTVAALPLYIKSHSYGEYVFDWAWAQAYQKHGLAYYPKLLSAIPFTPVQSPKLLARNASTARDLAHGLMNVATQTAQSKDLLGTQTSSLHVLFTTLADQEALGLSTTNTALQSDLMPRQVIQFHWNNLQPAQQRPFANFDEFLDSLQQKKRKNIRAERRKALEAGVDIQWIEGTEASQADLDFFYRCYAQTYWEHHSTPYLTPDFFKRICNTMGDQVLLVQATRLGKPVASSFFLKNQSRLYGRYWGATERLPHLHFELCYYQAIEYAIAHGIEWFEGGAQGEHKMARGLNPVAQWSGHWVADEGFKAPVARFLQREREHLTDYAQDLNEHLAFKQPSATLEGPDSASTP